MSADPPTLHVACLCAAWCQLCDSYGPVFEAALAPLHAAAPTLRSHWIDIEDEADLVGDVDVETFPTLVVIDENQVLFAGPLTPQPETLQRLLRSVLQEGQAGIVPTPELQAFAQRLRQRP